MVLYREEMEIETREGISITDITKNVEDILRKSGIKDGICNIFIPATTAGLITNEFDFMLFEDIKRFLSNLVGEKKIYSHTENAFSHLRTLFTKSDLSIPIKDGKLVLGTWQRILLMEFDIVPRKRRLIISIYDSKV
jgi:secondary thiamine-phosphate synthase enzyme